jgi:hypothetical protein
MADNAPAKDAEKAKDTGSAPVQAEQPAPDKPEKDGGEPLQVPEKLQNKSTEDLVKMYGELERKLGEQSGEVKQARDIQEKMNIVLKAISQDPELYNRVEKAVQTTISGEQPLSPDVKRGDMEAGKAQEPQGNDQRRYLENQAIADFHRKFGVDRLPSEERQKLMQEVSTAWANMIDPKGRKTKQELLSSVELDVLPQQLENAYWLAKKATLIDKGNLPNQDFASIGSVPGSSGKAEEGVTLTPQEQKIAEKLGIDPDKYAKQKQQIRKEFTE